MRLFKRTAMPASAADVYAFHARPDALARLIPPWERVRVVVPPASLAKGTRVVLRQWIGPFPFTIESVHEACQPGASFVDRMVRGPFASWVHEHRFEEVHPRASWLVDDVEYALPLEPYSAVVRSYVERRVERMFAYRHAVTLAAMNELASARQTSARPPPAT
jgi:ligand-binding SRPBCC domain-containing protein